MADENEKKRVGGTIQAATMDGLADGEDDDLGGVMSLFTEEDTVDETLALITASLDDIEVLDLLEQVREIQDIIDERRGR
jgi:hypothetical protein